LSRSRLNTIYVTYIGYSWSNWLYLDYFEAKKSSISGGTALVGYLSVIETLRTKAKGLTRSEIINNTGLANVGSTTRILNELEESGFIRRYTSFGNKEKHSLYQLSDFFS
jgi:DNA-binding MarR family transcriptional regulator